MKFSFTTMGTPELNGLEVIQLAKKLGYDGVDLRVSDYKGELTLQSTDNEISLLRQAFEEEGVLCAGLLCYGNRKVKIHEKDYWNAFGETLLREVEIGSKLASPSIRMFGGDISLYGNEEEYLHKMANGIEKALSTFTNMNIVLQNHCNSYTIEQGVKLARLLNHPRFGLAFSPDHCFLMQEDIAKVFALAKEFTKQIYISDISLDKSKINERNYISGVSVLPGKGNIQIREALQAIDVKSFQGFITFKWEKIWHNELEEPEIALPYFLTYIKKLLNTL